MGRTTQTEKMLNAIERGAQNARDIAKLGRVPLANVHPTLARLRAQGRLKGRTGKLRVVG